MPGEAVDGIVHGTMKVLVATDLSPGSERALLRAAMLLADLPSAHLRLLHVVEPGLLQRMGLGASGGMGNEGNANAVVLDRLAPLVRRASDLCSAEVAPVVAEGDARSCVLEQAKLQQPDLQIVGFSGQSSLRHMVFGSTAEYLAMRASEPMLVVKREPRAAYRRVLIPVVAEASAVDALSLARKLAPAAGLVLFHAYDVDVESQLRYASVAEDVIREARNRAHATALQQLREIRGEAGSSYANVALEAVRGHAAVAILDAEVEQDCDLIVMARHEASPVERFLLGSMTRRILLRSRADVLVMPPRRVPG